jgi:hypothetical protein
VTFKTTRPVKMSTPSMARNRLRTAASTPPRSSSQTTLRSRYVLCCPPAG